MKKLDTGVLNGSSILNSKCATVLQIVCPVSWSECDFSSDDAWLRLLVACMSKRWGMSPTTAIQRPSGLAAAQLQAARKRFVAVRLELEKRLQAKPG